MLIDQSVPLEYEHGGCRIACLVTGEKQKQNTYIVTHKSSSNTIVIDPGDNAEFIIRHIKDVGGRLTHILLTHPHHDHVGAVPQLSEHYDLACELHKLDVRLLMQAPTYALAFANKRISSISRFQAFEELCIKDEEPAVQSIHTPGHTKGSTCYLFDGFVFTGDTLLFKYIGRADLPGGSLQAIKASVTALLSELSDDTVIFPGHGKPWTVGDATIWWNDALNASAHHDQFISRLQQKTEEVI